jgi:hypothetical protein
LSATATFRFNLNALFATGMVKCVMLNIDSLLQSSKDDIETLNSFTDPSFLNPVHLTGFKDRSKKNLELKQLGDNFVLP